MLELKNKATSHAKSAEGEESKIKILTKLEKLEEELFTVKGKKREKALETYRELLRLLKEEHIYLVRYE